jgi:Tol biopolymer transport system component
VRGVLLLRHARGVGLLALAGGVLAVSPGAASRTQTPASNGWIVFASTRTDPEGRLQLHRLEPIGGRVAPLPLRGTQPTWSPDGSRIAFVDARYRLVVAAPDGTGARALTTGRYPARHPFWSPDGSRIVFSQSGRRRFRGDLVVAAADGSGVRRITRTNHDDLDPSWSPDGSSIAFASDRPVRLEDDYEIAVVRPNGPGLRAITANTVEDRSPAWSPDGSLLAFVSGRRPGAFNPGLWTMNRDGSGERQVQLSNDPTGFPSWSDTSPSWSPDGNWLVYVTTETYFPENVFIVRPDSQDKIDLTPESRSTDIDPAWQPVCSHPGTAGDDRLAGTLVDDRLCGFAGEDTIVGGSGRDGLYGGGDDDTLRSRDGSFDVVGCGPGRDTVVADRVDLVGIDCERVTRH